MWNIAEGTSLAYTDVFKHKCAKIMCNVIKFHVMLCNVVKCFELLCNVMQCYECVLNVT